MLDFTRDDWKSRADALNLRSQAFIGGKFVDASADLKDNFLAIFSGREADWRGLSVFFDEVFYPYLVGGLIPGAIAGTIAYFLSLPLIRAYKKRRKGAIKAKFEAIKARAEAQARAEAEKRACSTPSE